MWISRGSKLVNWLEVGLESHWTIIWWWASWQPWLWTWTSPSGISRTHHVAECIDWPCYPLNWLMLWKGFLEELHARINFLWSLYHVGWIIINDWKQPWHYPIICPGDMGWTNPWTRWTGFQRWGSRYPEMTDEMHKNKLPQCRFWAVSICVKIPQMDQFASTCPCTTVNAKIEGIFAPKLFETFCFQIQGSKTSWAMLGGLKSLGMCLEAWWSLSVCQLGPMATNGALTWKSMHRGLGAPRPSIF